MPTTLFLGTVLPELPPTTIESIPTMTVSDHTSLSVTVQVFIRQSEILVVCESSRTLQWQERSSLYMRALDFCRSAVNIRAFSTGQPLTVHLHSAKEEGEEVVGVCFLNERLSNICTAYRTYPGNGKEADDLTLILSTVMSDRAMFLALNDLIEAINFPHMASVNCGRAMESIRNKISPLARRKGWPVMNRALNCTEDYVMFITDNSQPGRHGDHTWSARLALCQWIRDTLDRRAYGARQEVPA